LSHPGNVYLLASIEWILPAASSVTPATWGEKKQFFAFHPQQRTYFIFTGSSEKDINAGHRQSFPF